MKRYKLIVAYDGTNYCGWQIQKNGITIEAVLNRCLSKLLKEEIIVIGASRTDSGVHSLGNVAVFDSNTKIPPERLSYALNQQLPDDIVIQHSCQVAADFHPRYCNTKKTYEYKILNRKFENPLLQRYSHFVYYTLDPELMNKAAKAVIGTHDFICFCSSRSQVKNTVRTIDNIEVRKDCNDIISIRITGNGFLYNMVRIIAGTLIEIGSGIRDADSLAAAIETGDRKKAGSTAPAKGLTLCSIEYLP